MKRNNNTLPIEFSDILIPKKSIDFSKWAVVACDQFTSNHEYWQELAGFIADSPSALNVTFPEIFLSPDNSGRIKLINQSMFDYLNDDIFDVLKEGAVLVNRMTPYNPQRLGVVLTVDLEEYSFVPQDKALIRATEGTILERIPPRVEIRKNAPLELPHIMLLIDDEKHSVIEPLFSDNNELLYDFELNMNGGRIKGYKLKDKQKLYDALAGLIETSRINERYNGERLLFAVGDGNHSLATAKACWDEIKKNIPADMRESHPARFALAEIVNIYDDGIKFEPIHRALFNINTEDFISEINIAFKDYTAKGQIIAGGRIHEIPLPENAIAAVDAVQKFCTAYAETHSGAVIDYIHGDEESERIGGQNNSLVIILPKMSKDELFPYIVNKGVLPRKTFSMGEGNEKRYYIEARKIK